MLSKPKSFRREYLFETISPILELHQSGQTQSEIVHHFKISKSFVTTIFHQQSINLKQPLQLTQRPGHLLKLDARAEQVIIYHLENFHMMTYMLCQFSLNLALLLLVEQQYGST